MALTVDSSFEEVAAYIIAETKRRNYTRDESVAALSTGIQESGLKPKAVSPNGKWRGIYQQDGGYPGRDDPNLNIGAFLDRLDVKRKSPGASGDPFKNIFWLQQRPSEPSADAAYNNGRKAYYDEIRQHIAVASRAYDRSVATPPPAPPSTPVGYGMPNGSNSGGYGGSGAKFPQWVYDLGNAFGLKPSTYRGHQESDRVEAGYARNPQRLNRGIDWAAPGAPDEVDRMQRFADYLLSIRGELEQVIWWNPRTGRKVGVAGGADVTNAPYFNYPGGYDDHRDHVHTRQSHSIPLPGLAPAPPPPPPPPAPPWARPDFTEVAMFGRGSSKRNRQPINFFLHTEEGNGTALSLAQYCQGQNNVSYHYTLRDRKVYDVVDTDLAAWAVLDANVFSINLCFAGSRAGMSRAEWLAREADIEIAAFLAVQDARKYGFSTEVLVPDYARTGADVYAGGPRGGISDHNYVTRELGIGNHTDVGVNFPWDVFKSYVAKYANPGTPTVPPPTTGDDFLMALSESEQREVLTGVRRMARLEKTRSPVRPLDQAPIIADMVDYEAWSNGGSDFRDKLELAKMGHRPTLELLTRNAAVTDSAFAYEVQIAKNILAEAERHWKLSAGPTIQTMNVAPSPVQVQEPSMQVGVDASAMRAQLDGALTEAAVLRKENSSLRSLLDAAQAHLAAIPSEKPPPETQSAQDVLASIPEYQDTTGDKIARAVDANMDYTDHVLAMDAASRTALTRALNSIDPVLKEKP